MSESTVYTVIFYERHGSKRKPKYDGTLTIQTPSCHATLRSNEDSCSQDECEVSSDQQDADQEKLKEHTLSKKSHKKSKDSVPTGLLFSGKCPEMQKKFAASSVLAVDDTVVISKWECQIMSIDSDGSKSGGGGGGIMSKTQTEGKRSMGIVPKTQTEGKVISGIVKRIPSLLNSSPSKKEATKQLRQLPGPNREPFQRKRKMLPENTINSSSDKQTPQESVTFSGAITPIEIPHSIKVSLRPHQVEGVEFLWNAITGSSPSMQKLKQERTKDNSTISDEAWNGAILGDIMGSGKTLMTIALLCGLFRRDRRKRFIIVCPSSLVSNWAKEFDKWIGKAQQPKRSVVLEGGESCVQKLRSFVPVKPNLSEILIISYDLFRLNAELITQASEIGLLVVDEGHRLKNSSTLMMAALSSLHCDARLLITGTPLQNNLSEFYNLVTFVCPGILGSSSDFKKVYERPIVRGSDKQATIEEKRNAEVLLAELDEITSAFMIRRAGKDFLASELPPRFEVLMFCDLSDVQSNIYTSSTSSSRNINLNSDISGDALGMIMQLRLLCSHPDLVTDESSASTLKSSKGDIDLSGKMVVLSDLLKSIRSANSSDKVVIVSNFTSVLSFIETYLFEANKWSFVRLDGQVELTKRQSIVDAFNRGNASSSFAFLLSAKAGGCGLNLIGGNRLIMMDCDWNPSIDLQAMARIYRLGQMKPCYVYRLFSRGTIEEVILQRQIQKLKLSSITIDSDDISSDEDSLSLISADADIFELKNSDSCDSKENFGEGWIGHNSADSLRQQGCLDEPLLNIIGKNKYLAYVHVVSSGSD